MQSERPQPSGSRVETLQLRPSLAAAETQKPKPRLSGRARMLCAAP